MSQSSSVTFWWHHGSLLSPTIFQFPLWFLSVKKQIQEREGNEKDSIPTIWKREGNEKKSIPKIRAREGNEKSIPIIRDRESEAFIPRNGREWEFPLTPATSLVHNQFEDYLVSFLTQLCDRMTCQRIVDRIIKCIFGKKSITFIMVNSLLYLLNLQAC